MCEEGAVGDVDDLDTAHAADGVNDGVEMRLVVGENGDVTDLRVALDTDEVDRVQKAARLADRGREPRKGAGMVLDPDADRSAERCGRVHTATVGSSIAGGI